MNIPSLRHCLTGLLAALSMTCSLLAAPVQAANASQIDQNNEPLRAWIELAEAGSPNMQYGLARMYSLGTEAIGVARNEEQAAIWYRRAADQGHGKAQFALGQAYEEGRGVKQDREAALHWYRRAADQGIPEAKEKLDAPLRQKTMPADSPAPASPAVIHSESEIMPGNFLSWWQGALLLGFIALAFWRITGSALGVSSSWDRIIHWRDHAELGRAERTMYSDRTRVTDAMLAETIAQFGKDAVADLLKKQPAQEDACSLQPGRVPDRRIPWQAHVTFLAMMAIGGLAASVLRGEFHLRLNLGPDFGNLFGSGPHIWAILLVGGFLVGFGTRMSGGCTSGHGLSGCARLQPGSLAATASFFGAAVVTSLLMEMLK